MQVDHAVEVVGLGAQIYGRFEPPDVHLAAWALRDLDPLLGEPEIDPDSKELRLPFGQLNALDQAAHRHQLDRLCKARPEAITLWKDYTWNRGARKRGEALMDVPVDRRWDKPLRDVQDELLQTLADKGVAIEANPSSNLAIATLGKLERHPIFRWLPVDPRERLGVPLPRVCVGSDDPAIFHTELLHEFALLAQAARETGRYTERDIRAWIDELRRAGLDLWFGEVLDVGE